MAENQGSLKKRILIVDNDLGMLDKMRAYLEPLYNVGTIAYSTFAVQYIEQNETDLILLDVSSTISEGMGTLSAIRNTNAGKNIPVVFLAEKNNRNIMLESLNFGVDGYLVKPIEKDVLLEKVATVIADNESMSSKKTILAVDDDVTYLKIINKSLKDSFNIIILNSVKLASEYLVSHVPDIVILDYQMKDSGSLSLMQYINNDSRLNNLPIIMMSGINDKNIDISSLPRRPDRFLIKPISKLDLVRAILASLSEHGKSLGS